LRILVVFHHAAAAIHVGDPTHSHPGYCLELGWQVALNIVSLKRQFGGGMAASAKNQIAIDGDDQTTAAAAAMAGLKVVR